MSKNKNKNCYPRHNKNGEIISYRFFFSGKDFYTGKPKQYTKTWKIPIGLNNKEIEFERKKFEYEFYKECEKKSLGTFIQDNNITFEEFSRQWLERILKRNEESFSYYVQAESSLKILNQYFGKYLLKQITPLIIQKFYDYLCDRTYIKETVTVKKSINDLITLNKLNKTRTAEDCGINRLTLRLSSRVGNQVSLETARNISRYFNVPLTQYFNVERKEIKYSKATNSGIRTILVIILGEAKRQQLIEHNYASKDYTRPITGTTKQKEIFTEQESKEFVQALLKEKNLKKRTIFALLIFLGLRKAEICGLSWEDIDFNKHTLSVKHNALYYKKFGIVTKKPKTENSIRTITLPIQLVNILQEYKQWYQEQKQNYGDLWARTDFLFLQDNGNIINPCTINSWLRDFNIKNGLKPIPPHSLRHTCITMQLNAGIPIKVVSTRAGHSNEQITLGIYTHTLQTQDFKAAQLYNNYLMN